MIVVDTSALMAVVLNEPRAPALSAVLRREEILISATTLAEALIVSRRRGVGAPLETLVNGLNMEVVPVSRDGAERVADAYDRWGKGVHPAGLNIVDCFAYALAKERGCPLLFTGDDFGKTDVVVATKP